VKINSLSWLVFELPTLPAEEREQFMHHFIGLQRAIRDRLAQYLEEPDQASDLAWVIVCAFLGYGQLFHTLDCAIWHNIGLPPKVDRKRVSP
jgi:hypothetical protein